MKILKLVNAVGLVEMLARQHEIEDTGLVYWLTKFVLCSDHERNFYKNEMVKIINKYAEKDEEGNVKYGEDGSFTVTVDNVALFNDAIIALDNTEVDAPNIKLPLSLITKEFKLSMEQMFLLIDFIDENK